MITDTTPRDQEQPQPGRIVTLDPANGGSLQAVAAILLRIAQRTLDEDRQAVVQSQNDAA